MSGRLIIFSAPSGAGKSTLVHYLLGRNLNLEFSISATSRAPRGSEQDGVDYYYLTPDEFRKKIENDEFIEYEEVYPDCYYGTLRSEIERISTKGNNIIFDIDVVGGVNLKNKFKESALSVFVAPPDVDALRNRLVARATDTPEMIEKRVAKAAHEMIFADKFDFIIVNDDLEQAKAKAESEIKKFVATK
jgi:guanylate kinase